MSTVDDASDRPRAGARPACRRNVRANV